VWQRVLQRIEIEPVIVLGEEYRLAVIATLKDV
jgi:hypothetical protein